jgi:3-keto-5-aminohexanoate cleavage enzyme
VRQGTAIIEVGINEGVTRARNPHVPYSPAECADDAGRCAEAGAAVVHWHARDPESGEQRAADPDLYGDALDRMRADSDVVAYPTYPTQPPDDLEARLGHCWALRERHGLEMAPIDIGSVNVVTWDEQARDFAGDVDTLSGRSIVANSLGFTLAALERFDALGLAPSVAAFDVGFTRTMVMLVESGRLHEPVFFKIFLSGAWAAGPYPSEDALDFHLRQIPDGLDVEWLVVPYLVGDAELVERLCRHALERGGGIRVGIGDNPAADPAATNAELVERAAGWVADAGREPATAADVRARFALTTAKEIRA